MTEPLDVRRMLMLKTVAETGSLTEAARVLTFTTSAISQQIAKLEREADVPLIHREPRGVRLTDAGEALVAHARALERQLAAAQADMEDFRSLRRGGLRLGTFPTVAAALMPGFVTSFRDQYPSLDLEIKSARIDSIVDWILRHEVDLATMWEYPWLRVREEGIDVAPIMVDPTMLVLPDGHPLSRRRSVDLRQLSDELWVTRGEHPVADVLGRICREAGFEPKVSFAASDYTELQAMVAAGIGIAIAPRLAVLEPRKGVKVVPIKGSPAPRRILVAWASTRAVSPAMRGGVAIFRQVGRSLSRSGRPTARRKADPAAEADDAASTSSED